MIEIDTKDLRDIISKNINDFKVSVESINNEYSYSFVTLNGEKVDNKINPIVTIKLKIDYDELKNLNLKRAMAETANELEQQMEEFNSRVERCKCK